MGQDKQQKTNNDSNNADDSDVLIDDFDEKLALHAAENDSSTAAHAADTTVEEEMDEKAALHREHQDEIDALFSETPPNSRPPEDTAAKRNEAELQHIFEQFDGKQDGTENKNEEEEKPKDSTESQDGSSSSSKGSTSTSPQHKRVSSVAESATSSEGGRARRPSLAEIRKSADETKGREKQEIPFDFNRFVAQMKRRSAAPITRYFKSFLQAFDRRPWAVNEQIKIIQDFLDFIYVKMRECEVWRDVSEQEFENAKEGMEKLVMNRLYHATFSPSTTDDKERDEILHQKISIFRWIREEHLDIPKTPHNETFLTFAESELLKINNYKAPRDKLICILNCCKVIFGLIKHVEGEAGADKFLPILIYVVIRANPPRLVSNVQYISRFRNPEHLQSESGYYLTNLMGSITFIETMDASSLSITKEEFDANIERTMSELEQERPSVTQDKQKINYDNAIHPSRSPRVQAQPLIDPVKATALLEKGSSFAQKTMQKPLNFVGKIFQGLNEGSPDNDESSSQRYHQQQQQGEDPRSQYGSPEPRYGYHHMDSNNAPHFPPRPLPPDPRVLEAQRAFDVNLQNIISMFPNVEPNVCFMILQANEGHVSQTIDTLLEISASSDVVPEQRTREEEPTILREQEGTDEIVN